MNIIQPGVNYIYMPCGYRHVVLYKEIQQDFGIRIPTSGFRIPTGGFRIPTSGFRIPTGAFSILISCSELLLVDSGFLSFRN